MIFILFLWLPAAVFADANVTLVEAGQYLAKFGYLETSNNSVIDIKDALARFQEFFGLPTDGELNAETLALMNRPRCANKDDLLPFALSASKWKKTHLTWNFVRANLKINNLVHQAFQRWQSVCNLTFERNMYKPDILLSFEGRNHSHHQYSCMGGHCSEEFDGRGTVLAHAYFPSANDSCREIHFDSSEYWYFGGIDAAPLGYESFYAVVLHEIGHAIGIHHSGIETSLMYSFYNSEVRDLSPDDIDAATALYPITNNLTTEKPTATSRIPPPTTSRIPATSPSIPTSTTENPTQKTTENPTQKTTEKPTLVQPTDQPDAEKPKSPEKTPLETAPNICAIYRDIRTVAVIDKTLYLFYKNWCWFIQLDSFTVSDPIKITDYLSFLPSNFKEISHIFQRNDRDTMIVVKNIVYIVDIPSLNVLPGYEGRSIVSLGLPIGAKINAIFNTYAGRTFIIYNDVHAIEYSECQHRPKDHNLASKLFTGIPTNISSAFRYTDGLIYFISGEQYYAYSEFTDSIVKSDRFDISTFGVRCGVIEQIKILLERLSALS